MTTPGNGGWNHIKYPCWPFSTLVQVVNIFHNEDKLAAYLHSWQVTCDFGPVKVLICSVSDLAGLNIKFASAVFS